MAIHIPIKEKWVSHIQFPWEKGAYRIPGSAEKGGYSGRLGGGGGGNFGVILVRVCGPVF